MEPRNVIFRHSEPTAMDESPRGSVCFIKHHKEMDVYLQIHDDNVVPKWEFIDTILVETPQHVIDALLEKRLTML